MSKTNDLIFMDVEASSLRPHSHPIEIGWARLFAAGDIAVDSVLIRPALSQDDWDPAAEKVHGIPLADLFTHGLPAADAITKIALSLGGETVYSDSERDKAQCRALFNLWGRGNPFRWRHVDALLIDKEPGISGIAYQVAWDLVEHSGPVPHRAGPDVARTAIIVSVATGIDRMIGRVAERGGDREAAFARAEEAARVLIERYLPLLARPGILIGRRVRRGRPVAPDLPSSRRPSSH